MKKLLTLAVILASASLAQAAALGWSAMKIYQPKNDPSDPNVQLSGGLAYLFITEQSSNFGSAVTTVDAVKTLIESGAEYYTEGDNKYLKKGDDKIQIAAVGATTSTGMLSGKTGYNGENFGAGDSVTGFAVVFDANTLAGASNYIVTAEKSVSFASATGTRPLGFGDQSGNAWTPVPEPSTAALALAGLALLLKRRRA